MERWRQILEDYAKFNALITEVGERLSALRVEGGRAMMDYAKRHLRGHGERGGLRRGPGQEGSVVSSDRLPPRYAASGSRGRRRRRLEDAFAKALEEDFEGRVLPFDQMAAHAAATIAASVMSTP